MAEFGDSMPIGSMYGVYIYANIGGILMVNVTIYTIYGSYGMVTVFLGPAVKYQEMPPLDIHQISRNIPMDTHTYIYIYSSNIIQIMFGEPSFESF